MSSLEQRIAALEKKLFGRDLTPAAPALPDGYLSPHFRKAEFACNHCGEMHPSGIMPPQSLLEDLETIRAHFGSPVTINSGYRCPVHNSNVGGAPRSKHMEGIAADIMVKNVPASLVYAFCDELIGNRGGVGRYKGFTHIDHRGYRERW